MSICIMFVSTTNTVTLLSAGTTNSALARTKAIDLMCDLRDQLFTNLAFQDVRVTYKGRTYHRDDILDKLEEAGISACIQAKDKTKIPLFPLARLVGYNGTEVGELSTLPDNLRLLQQYVESYDLDNDLDRRREKLLQIDLQLRHCIDTCMEICGLNDTLKRNVHTLWLVFSAASCDSHGRELFTIPLTPGAIGGQSWLPIIDAKSGTTCS